MADDRYWDPALDDIQKFYDPEGTGKLPDVLWAQRMAEASAAIGDNDAPEEEPWTVADHHASDEDYPTVDIPVDLDVTIALPLGGTEVAMLLEAWAHWEDHQCEWGEDALLEVGGLIVDEMKRRLIDEGILDESWSPDD